MALWFKKKHERTLEFNYQKLQTEMENLSGNLHKYKAEMGVAIVREMIQMLYNTQVLLVNGIKDEKALLRHQGKIDAIMTMSQYIEQAINRRPKDEPVDKPRGTTRIRSVDHQAKAAL